VFGCAAKNPSCDVVLFFRSVWETGVIDKPTCSAREQ
jgi:hypothetical protein